MSETKDEKETVVEKTQLSGYKTLTGVPAEEISARLMERFEDPKAYKGTGPPLDLTDINTGYMLERVTEVFGPKGFGWNLLWEPEDMEIIGQVVPTRRNSERSPVAARLKWAWFEYTLQGPEKNIVYSIPTSGFSINDPAYAEEGARTNAIGSAIKGLGFQLDIYKGLLDHKTVNKEEYERQQAEAEAKRKQQAEERKKKAEEAKKKKAEQDAKDAEEMTKKMTERALVYVAPEDLPHGGKTLGELLKIEPVGLSIIGYLAGEKESPQGKLFEAKTKDDKKLQEAAKHLWETEELADRLNGKELEKEEE